MGRIMAVDWGRRRVGVALSDESRTIASPHAVVSRGKSLDLDLLRLAGMAEESGVDLILLGMPMRTDGSPGPEAEDVLEVAEKLQVKVPVPVETFDERFSTVAAERALIDGDVSRVKRRQKVDQVAAALFLQAYLDKRGSGF